MFLSVECYFIFIKKKQYFMREAPIKEYIVEQIALSQMIYTRSQGMSKPDIDETTLLDTPVLTEEET